MPRTKHSANLARKRNNEKWTHQKLDVDHLRAMTKDSLGITDFLILFDPFGVRIDHIIIDVIDFLEENGCKILDRHAPGNNWVPNKIKFSSDVDKYKIFTWFFRPIGVTSLPTAFPIIVGMVTSSVMDADAVTSALALSKGENVKGQSLHVINHQIQ